MPAELITASYATSTVAFAVLAVLLLTSWKGRLQGGLLVCAVLTTVLWSGLLTYQAYVDALDARSVFATEVLRDIAWLLFLLKLLEERLSSRRALIQIAIVTVLLAASAWFIAGITQAEGPVWRAPKGLIVVFIALAVNGIVLIEQLYRNAQPEHRWKIKFLCLGLGSIMSYDLYMYSHALLVQNLQGVMWWSRGLLNAIVAPLIMVAAARNPHWSLDVFVSRKVVFHSFSLVAIGIYLLAMSFVGYAINLQGGVWGQTLQIAFLFGAAVLLALVLLSGQIRAKIKVFLNKHFFNYKYDYRDEWLRLTNTLAAADASDELPLGAIQCLGQIVDSRGGVLYLHDEEEGGCAAVQTFEVTGPCEPLPVSAPLWRFLRRRHWIVDLAEHATNPGRYDHMEIDRKSVV